MATDHAVSKATTELDFGQTRRLLLAATVAFPTPFPTARRISIEPANLRRSKPSDNSVGTADQGDDGSHCQYVAVVCEKAELSHAIKRVILLEHIAAFFFPGTWENRDFGRVFRFADEGPVHDLEEGEWFLWRQTTTNEERIEELKSRFEINNGGGKADGGNGSASFSAVGIAFVDEHRSVLTIHETSETARASIDHAPSDYTCDPTCHWR